MKIKLVFDGNIIPPAVYGRYNKRGNTRKDGLTAIRHDACIMVQVYKTGGSLRFH